ncbi:MAG: hypothetical protein QOK48_1122 [Blastocatellia bacterium]|jgi:hypothetical protein|nr:hypothetical protein [Blastocatellia bacterium]
MHARRRHYFSNNAQVVIALLCISLLIGVEVSPKLHAAAQAPQDAPITKANWNQHPKIKAVRAIVAAVDAGVSRKTLKVSVRKFEYCEPYEDTLRRKAVDAKGRVRMYEKQGGSDDSSLTTKHFYDEAGRLRFVFITGGATNGSQLEQRIYFDEAGQRIWEEHKYVKGPGYTFPEVWPDDQLQLKDPAGAYAARSPCPETKIS